MGNRSHLSRTIGGLFLFFLIIGGVIYLARPAQIPMVSDGKLQVVAAENFWGNIAQQLGGKYVQVTSIISNPNLDPHLYESNAIDAAAVSSSNVVIVNGLGYDDFMNKLINGSNHPGQQVITAAQVLNEPQGSNQHLWYDIPRINQIAAKITGSYIISDPIHKQQYQGYLSAFDKSMQKLDRTITFIKLRYAGTPVAYTEPVPGYLLSAAGLDVKTPEGFAKSIEDGDEPSPADAYAMDKLMIDKSVKVLLYNAQATSPVTENVKLLARQHNIPVLGVTETMPPHEKSYQSWMQSVLNQLLKMLGA